jgi:putative transposase
MPDTPENQAIFPQIAEPRPGVGLPIARACVVLSLATAGVCDLAVGPCEGKETGESALLRGLLETFDPSDVVVFDWCYGSFLMLALQSARNHAFTASSASRRRRTGCLS